MGLPAQKNFPRNVKKETSSVNDAQRKEPEPDQEVQVDHIGGKVTSMTDGASKRSGMDHLRIEGGKELKGRVPISGAKNAVLILMCAAILTDDEMEFSRVPDLADIQSMCLLLDSLGVSSAIQGDSLRLTPRPGELKVRAEYDLVRRMRASILVLGPLVARHGRATVSLPGGCAIGARPVDLHLDGLRQMGAELTLENGNIEARASQGVLGGGLRGGRVNLAYPSVGATETLLLAAAVTPAVTRIEGAAREPEIVALGDCLVAMGAVIEGTGTDVIEIQGLTSLHGIRHEIIPDRIEAGSYALAVAAAGGDVFLEGARADHLQITLDLLQETGVKVSKEQGGLRIIGRAQGPFRMETSPWPGHPTDLQAQWMAVAAGLDGTSHITETVFEGRYMHVAELRRLGANIDLSGREARIEGAQLVGAPVMATDLRASMSLVIAGLAAEGVTTVLRLYHLDRGYERLHEKLADLGARVERLTPTGS